MRILYCRPRFKAELFIPDLQLDGKHKPEIFRIIDTFIKFTKVQVSCVY